MYKDAKEIQVWCTSSTTNWQVINHGASCPLCELSIGRVVHGANCPWGELSMWWAVHGVNCPWGKLSMGQAMYRVSCSWGKLSTGRAVHGARCHGRVVMGQDFLGQLVMERVVRKSCTTIILISTVSAPDDSEAWIQDLVHEIEGVEPCVVDRVTSQTCTQVNRSLRFRSMIIISIHLPVEIILPFVAFSTTNIWKLINWPNRKVKKRFFS
jgi:hypothetical protein